MKHTRVPLHRTILTRYKQVTMTTNNKIGG